MTLFVTSISNSTTVSTNPKLFERMHIRRTGCPHLPVGRSQVLTEQSMEEVTSHRPSGLNDYSVCVCVCAYGNTKQSTQPETIDNRDISMLYYLW